MNAPDHGGCFCASHPLSACPSTRWTSPCRSDITSPPLLWIHSSRQRHLQSLAGGYPTLSTPQSSHSCGVANPNLTKDQDVRPDLVHKRVCLRASDLYASIDFDECYGIINTEAPRAAPAVGRGTNNTPDPLRRRITPSTMPLEHASLDAPAIP